MFSLSIYLNTKKKPIISRHEKDNHHWVVITNPESEANDIVIFLKTKKQAQRVMEALRDDSSL